MGPEPLSRRTFLSAAGLAGLSIPILSACGGDDSGNSDSATEQVTIEWWNIATTEPGKSLWPKLAKEYEAAHPNVKIKFVATENDAYKAKMTAQTASGKLPDIFHTWGGGVLKQQIDAGLVKDLTKDVAPWVGTLLPAALAAYKFDGKTYGIPFDTGMVGFWYNKELFAKAKIDTPPATWAEYLEAIRALKGAGVTPIALAGKEKWPGMYYWAYLAMRVAGLPALQQTYTTNDFNGPGFVQAGRHLKELVDLDPFQRGFLNASYPTSDGQAAQMGNGKTAMELMGQWAPSVQSDAGKGIGDDLGFFPFPTVDGGQGTVTEVFGGGGGHALSKDAPKAAVDFLKWFGSLEIDRRLVQSKGYQPVVKGAESELTDPNLKVVNQALVNSTGFQLFLDQGFPPAVGQEVNDSVAALIAGKSTPEKVTQAITQTAKSQ
ncbi:extracellular solute-binding protein [Actinomadura sp. HBU206391]|uniref:extracellular solute-binding protein n=1 Tax=Actinomadura sp. HBU206391 TaxID=2731692 RepID=UPI0016509102|nr:extracellular solute-binding protein [Actinomadura sp. HBU206391]MBC6458198.1 extracellular solute-binding protein [Actinomadura sp. HBU206391]